MLFYQIALSLIREIGPVNGRRLIAYMGSTEAIFKGNKKKLMQIPGISTGLVNKIYGREVMEKAEKEMRYIEKNNIKPLFFSDEAYPQRLRHCTDAPMMLYYKGNTDLNSPRMLAIVGTRSSTDYGKLMVEKIIEGLKEVGIVVVSGLAFGIDSHAHRFSLKHDLQTIGVLAHGHDRMYPAQNKTLAEKMITQGGVITEWGTGIIPEKIMFPRRNRIIAGMSDATLVVEAGEKGGALITAQIAESYSRDVFAVPGRSFDNHSKGCNNLIKKNIAALADSGKDIMELMNWDLEKTAAKNQQRKLFVQLSGEEKMIAEKLNENGPVTIDWLSVETNMPSSKLSSILLKLEFEGMVKTLPGNQYQLI